MPLRRNAYGASVLLALAGWLLGPTAVAEQKEAESAPRELLPKEAHQRFEEHATAVYRTGETIELDLQLPVADERVLRHLHKRGFVYLQALLTTSYQASLTQAASTVLAPETTQRGASREEEMAAGLLNEAVVNLVLANRLAWYHAVKYLAPTPEALKLEEKAKLLYERMEAERGQDDAGASKEVRFRETLRAVRDLFDAAEDLPKMTPEQFADERAEAAVLAPSEYEESVPWEDRKAWLEKRWRWQRQWEHSNFLVAFSQNLDSDDYNQFQLVVNQRGGIFEWNRRHSGSHFFPDSYESMLTSADLEALKQYLATLPPADPPPEAVRYVISFRHHDQWITRTYKSLPAGSPFDTLVRRMTRQSAEEWPPESPPSARFLEELPAEGQAPPMRPVPEHIRNIMEGK